MTFVNQDIRVMAPMDPNKGQIYIEPMKGELLRGWDHAYNISEDYIHPTANKELGWRSTSSASSDSDDALDKWKNRMHKVSFRKCGLIIKSLFHVATEIVKSQNYKGIPDLSGFLMEFEEKVSEPQRLLALEEEMKDSPSHWWATHKDTIIGSTKFRWLMTMRFSDA